MKKNYLHIIALITLVILLFSQLINAQNKSAVQSNFVNPFTQKQGTGISQPITPTGQSHSTPVHKKQDFIFQAEGDYFLVKFTEDSKIAVEDFFVSFAKDFRITETDNFNLSKSEKDDIGFTHYRYQQLYKGIAVMGGEYLLHEKNGNLVSANGNVYSGLLINTIPDISKETAIQNAIRFVGAEKYQWENQNEENFLKEEKNDSNATNYPKAELIIAPINGIYTRENFRLCYKINVASEKPYDIVDVFIDAHTGESINKISKIAFADVPGTASTLYSGTKPITMDSYNGSYRLRESGRPIQTYNMNNGTNYSNAIDFTNATTSWSSAPRLNNFTISNISTSWWYSTFTDESPDLFIKIKDGSNQVVYTSNHYNNVSPPNVFNNINISLINPPYTIEVWDYDIDGNDFGGSYSITQNTGNSNWSGNGNNGFYNISLLGRAELDAHWAIEKTYDFYLTQLNRNSFDNAGGLIKSYIHYGTGFNNGYWNGSVITLGDGDGVLFNPTTCLDFVGHELTHGVVQYTANLVYQGESGALNESFADIFGTAIEFYVGNSPNWTMFENNTLFSPFYSRSLSNPNSGPPSQNWQQPDTYLGTYWVNTSSTQDNGGVHTNSGVQNYWFYLLSQGGSGTNDLGNPYSVAGIGITAATKIAYRNLANYLTSNSNYMSSYYNSLQATADLYGNPSTQYTAVRQAWYAVGIGNDPNNYCSGTTNLTALSGTISDGSGIANYNNNANCKWVITPPGATKITLNFTSFDTELDYDTVYVYDGPNDNYPLLLIWSGNTIPPAISTTTGNGAMCIKFKSDISYNYAGWSANYTTIGITPTCSGDMVFSTPTGTFTDGSGSSNYGNNQQCSWYIAPPCATSVTLTFSEFNTEQNYDGVIIYDDYSGTNQLAVYSGNTIPTSVTSTTGKMLVIFVSDFLATYQGFTAIYSSTGSAYCSGVTTLNTSDYGTINDGSGTNNYCDNMDCRWLIQPPQATSVTFNFTAFDVESMSTDGTSVYDAVEVYDGINTSAPLLGRFAGNAIPPSVTSTGGSMYIRFFSDVFINKTGWSGNYTSKTADYCDGTTTLTTQSGTISDGSATLQYGNSADCKWLIQPANAISITLNFSSFDTELNNDGVLIYDGNNTSAPQLGMFSGSTIPSSITSTSGSMLIWFLTNEKIRKNGWNASYNSIITGINDIVEENKTISVYPNPFTNKITVEFNLEKESQAEITVTNILGQTVKQYSLQKMEKNYKQVIEMNDLPLDIYFIKILVNGELKVFKTIKIK